VTVGNIYAWGAVGSIVGTFLTGFVLISWMGTRAIVCSVSGGLGLMGLLLVGRRRGRDTALALAWIAFVAGISIPAAGPWPRARRLGLAMQLRDDAFGEFQRESSYATITVKPDLSKPNTKVLVLDNLVHSLVSLDSPTRLEYPYSIIYAAVTERVIPRDRPLRAFFIGGGGFVFPRYLEAVYACERLDVAEIDPMVKWVSQEELGLPADDQTQITTYLMDARNFVEDRMRENGHSAEPVVYDLVYGDAFNDFSVPYHLLTEEFNDDISRILAPKGVYLVNFVDIYREGLGRCLGAYVNTLLRTFPNVYLFFTERFLDRGHRHTFVIICGKQAIDLDDLGRRAGDREFHGSLFASAEGDRWQGEMETIVARGRHVTLTDDYAPVDNLLAPVFRER
jgi:spermidine synthase